MSKSPNLQDVFLASARRTETPVTMFLMNGFQMRGVITGFDSFTVVLTAEGKQNMIYKHAISTISPAKGLDLSDWEDTL
ncbi:MAG: RNA chaperone Hfq [Oscillospiraceae bacterium]|jgi:host factor-I protein|nr:RNA chaperone Hfq [Oscillospiraceae bacterium]MDE6996401.1 RNA chaperone Hfq [Oscillospiraceae bacterium]